MSEWLHALTSTSAAGTHAVLVTIAAGKGSTPREAGTKMVVTDTTIAGTIGGGELEHQAIGMAREMLRAGASHHAKRFPLGADLGQNCGGTAHLVFEHVAPQAEWVARIKQWHDAGAACVSATLMGANDDARLLVGEVDSWGTLGSDALDAEGLRIGRVMLAERANQARWVAVEIPAHASRADGRSSSQPSAATLLVDPIRPTDFRIQLFGAGHVGRALARVLGAVSCEVDWIDSRAGEFPREIASNARIVLTTDPAAEVDKAAPGTYFVVMTHSHALDFSIVERVLMRDDIAFCGLIGSDTKRRSFENGFVKHGLPRERLDRLVCPIGIAGLNGKEPGTIAVGVAAQLLAERERALTER